MTIYVLAEWLGAIRDALIITIMVLFLTVGACTPVLAELPEWEGWSGGYVHTSDPTAGVPFNDNIEWSGDMVGFGPYWSWRQYEAHLWLGAKRDRLSEFGHKTSAGASFMVMRKWGRK